MPGHKILDNGEAESFNKEIKNQITGADLVHLGKAIGAKEVVVPDRMGDCDETLRLAARFRGFYDDGIRYMGVVQGSTAGEVFKCLDGLMEFEYITCLALPRVLNRIHREMRLSVAVQLMNDPVYRDRFHAVHCLGSFGAWPAEVRQLAQIPILRGVDTSAPVVLGLDLKSISHFKYGKRQHDYFNIKSFTPGQKAMVDANCRTYLRWARASATTSTS